MGLACFHLFIVVYLLVLAIFHCVVSVYNLPIGLRSLDTKNAVPNHLWYFHFPTTLQKPYESGRLYVWSMPAPIGVAVRVSLCAYLVMCAYSLTVYIPQLMGGTLVQTELARIWGIFNFLFMLDILRCIFFFLYYFLLVLGSFSEPLSKSAVLLCIAVTCQPVAIIRKMVRFLCVWGAISLVLYITN